MSTKSFLYTGAKTVDAFGCGEPHCPVCEAANEVAELSSPEPFTVLRTNDTEKRLTEGEDDDD
jgi:hypothetical protein